MRLVGKGTMVDVTAKQLVDCTGGATAVAEDKGDILVATDVAARGIDVAARGLAERHMQAAPLELLAKMFRGFTRDRGRTRL